MALVGCPSEFGKDGRIGKAVEKDVQEQFENTGCSEEEKKRVCEGPYYDKEKCQQCRG